MEFFNGPKIVLTSHQKRVFTVCSVLGLIVFMPIEILHVLMWIVIHIYELLEFILDEAIAHVFDMPRHTTQVIVFYLMQAMFWYGLYRAMKRLKDIFCKKQMGFAGWWAKQKETVADFWKHLPLGKRVQMIFGCTFSMVFLAMTVF